MLSVTTFYTYSHYIFFLRSFILQPQIFKKHDYKLKNTLKKDISSQNYNIIYYYLKNIFCMLGLNSYKLYINPQNKPNKLLSPFY